MIDLTLGEIAEIVGGRVLDADPATPVTGTVEFDSRKVTPGGLFLALPGERVDGHDFVAGALDAGAAAALVAREVPGPAVLVPPVEHRPSTAMALPPGMGSVPPQPPGELPAELTGHHAAQPSRHTPARPVCEPSHSRHTRPVGVADPRDPTPITCGRPEDPPGQANSDPSTSSHELTPLSDIVRSISASRLSRTSPTPRRPAIASP